MRSMRSSVKGNPLFLLLCSNDLNVWNDGLTTSLTRCNTRAVAIITSAQAAPANQTTTMTSYFWNLANSRTIRVPAAVPTEPRKLATLSSTTAQTTDGFSVRTWMRQAKKSWTDTPIMPWSNDKTHCWMVGVKAHSRDGTYKHAVEHNREHAFRRQWGTALQVANTGQSSVRIPVRSKVPVNTCPNSLSSTMSGHLLWPTKIVKKCSSTRWNG